MQTSARKLNNDTANHQTNSSAPQAGVRRLMAVLLCCARSFLDWCAAFTLAKPHDCCEFSRARKECKGARCARRPTANPCIPCFSARLCDSRREAPLTRKDHQPRRAQHETKTHIDQRNSQTQGRYYGKKTGEGANNLTTYLLNVLRKVLTSIVETRIIKPVSNDIQLKRN